MNKRQKKKQLSVQYHKAYKGLQKYCQRRRLTNPEYDWHLPKFKKWKKGVIFQIRCMKVFGLQASPIYPPNIMSSMVTAYINSRFGYFRR